MSRVTGKIARWNHERGFGFIKPDDGSKDVFVHIKDLNRVPDIGDAFEFEVETTPKGLRATNVKALPTQPKAA